MGRRLQWFQLIPAIYNYPPAFQFQEKVTILTPTPLQAQIEGKIGAVTLSTTTRSKAPFF
jgi:hypothetical protein